VATRECICACVGGVIAAAMYLRELQSKPWAWLSRSGGVMLSKATTSGGIVSGVCIRGDADSAGALMGVWVLRTRPKSGGLAKIQRQRLMVLVSLAAMCGLVQYPSPRDLSLYALPLTLLPRWRLW